MSIALYRRYRPQTFQEVIGQEHVTTPIMAALRTSRTAHAYLFSGPRGCGKTTSARILARCLNCAAGPSDTPCGTCPSCVDLSRDGSGSLDVVEIDAASHGGVEDTRDLRARAAFAPVRDRYKIFIIDEAHMVTNEGFNALLKIVEEPPAHIKFIFATTEPEKVLLTIRSRTHHYPFRLVPPDTLSDYLEKICQDEKIQVAPGVLPLVVRAGGGSVRDTLSVIDQLIAGQENGILEYKNALALLGFTDDELLDDTLDALGAADGAALFQVVDRVINSGIDPRRFMEDLLERIRDLVVVAVAGDKADAVLSAGAKLRLDRLKHQARVLGIARASHAADLVNEAIMQAVGALSPRLQIEILCARMMLEPLTRFKPEVVAPRPLNGVDSNKIPHPTSSIPTSSTPVASVSSAPVAAVSASASAPLTVAPAHSTPATTVVSATPGDPAAPAQTVNVSTGSEQKDFASQPETSDPKTDTAASFASGLSAGLPVSSVGAPETPVAVAASTSSSPGTTPSTTASVNVNAGETPNAPAPAPASSLNTPAETGDKSINATQPANLSNDRSGEAADSQTIRARWQEVLAAVREERISTWTLISRNSYVSNLHDGKITIVFRARVLARSFLDNGHVESLTKALYQVLGMRLQVVVSVEGEGELAASPKGESPSEMTEATPPKDDFMTESSAADVDIPPPPPLYEAVANARASWGALVQAGEAAILSNSQTPQAATTSNGDDMPEDVTTATMSVTGDKGAGDAALNATASIVAASVVPPSAATASAMLATDANATTSLVADTTADTTADPTTDPTTDTAPTAPTIGITTGPSVGSTVASCATSPGASISTQTSTSASLNQAATSPSLATDENVAYPTQNQSTSARSQSNTASIENPESPIKSPTKPLRPHERPRETPPVKGSKEAVIEKYADEPDPSDDNVKDLGEVGYHLVEAMFNARIIAQGGPGGN